jgi:hypothetical protein
MFESPRCATCGSTGLLTKAFGTLKCWTCRPPRCRRCRQWYPDVRFIPHKKLCEGCLSAQAERKIAIRARAVLRHVHRAIQPATDHSRQHLAWIREQPCLIGLPCCMGVRVHAHHVRRWATGAGMGKLPTDAWAVPLCALHHREGHDRGWTTFEALHHVDLLAQARSFARWSPFLRLDSPAVSEPSYKPPLHGFAP